MTPEALERKRETNRLWKINNPERVKAYNDAYAPRWRAENPEKYRANYKAQNTKRYAEYAAVRSAVIDLYGGECECCGERRKEFLAFDHREGGGNKERKSSGYSGLGFLEALLRKKREDIRVLCHNCNCSHGFYGYCPHEKE